MKKSSISKPKETSAVIAAPLINDIRRLINETRSAVAVAVNAGLTILYWKIGQRVNNEILKNKRAEYGVQIVSAVSRQLEQEYGEGFKEKNLHRMLQFSESFPKEQIVVTLSRQLSWSHFVAILPVHERLARDFYAEMCRVERWSVRTLRKKIDSMVFERTALSRKPEKVVEIELKNLREEDKLTPDLVFRDPYFLNFLGLKGAYQEKDIEAAILREMEAFILELGTGFTFVARQKRVIVGGEDFYLDLLFYHRDLQRLVAIELKLDAFKPAYKGQMELYLKWLDKYERKNDEHQPIGLILCAGKNHETIELLDLDKSGIKVASYLTKALPRKMLESKLREAIKRARMQFEMKELDK